MIHPYKPTAEDITFFTNLFRMCNNNATWGIPNCCMVYQLDKTNKVLRCTTTWDESPMTMLTHHHNDYICRELGWRIEPAVDWESLAKGKS